MCYVKYGATTAYDQQTKMLGTPDVSFTTLLTGLNPNQTYNYKIVAEDNAGNVSESSDQTFTTTNSGVYIFTPAADTYIERNRDGDAGTYSHLYGQTRAFGNYSWMNLMSANGRYCYLKFKIPNSLSNIRPITLRLYSRQGGQSGVNLYQFNPSPNWETTVTWANQNSVGGQSGNGFQDSNGGITGPLLGSIASPMSGNQWYSFSFTAPSSVVSTVDGNFFAYHFALQGTGNTPAGTEKLTQDVSFDSRESTNNQPEFIIVTAQTSFAEVTLPSSLPGVENGEAVWGDYDKDENLDLVITGVGGAGPLSKIFRNLGNGNGFVDIAAPLEPLSYSAADWGDFDMDNDLDLLLAGQTNSSGSVTKVYQYDNGNFVEKTTSLIGVKYCDVAWGNYNNDRYLDLVLSGQGSSSGFATKLYLGGVSGGTHTWTSDPINSTSTLPQLKHSSVAWGDNNLDGYIDLLLAGINASNTNLIEIYRNKPSGSGTRSFEFATYQLPQQGSVASCAWGNFDTDDDLDIAYAGRLNALTSVYSRSSTGAYDTFPVDDDALPDVTQGTVAWGDYDNDSDLDLLLTGQTATGVRISKVYRNDPPPQGLTSRQFVDIAAPLTGVHSGSAAWGDYDNDGDLDILLTGNAASGKITKIYQNLTNVPNNLPSPPVPLNPVYSSANNTYTLSWNNSNNPDETPAITLTYNVMIGTQSGGNGGYDLVSPMSKIATGKRFIPAPGNAGTKNTYILNMNGLVNGTY